jgi:hypothetical protein
MASATVKIDAETYAKLRETAAEAGEPMIEVLAKAIEAYRRRAFLDALNNDFATVRSDPQAWSDELTERAAWDNALADDIGGD